MPSARPTVIRHQIRDTSPPSDVRHARSCYMPSASSMGSSVTEPQTFDISTRVKAPLHGSEIAILRGSLTYQRDTLRWKCSGLTQEQLAQPLPPTNMTLGGMMKHLALVESQWFDHHFRDV